MSALLPKAGITACWRRLLSRAQGLGSTFAVGDTTTLFRPLENFCLGPDATLRRALPTDVASGGRKKSQRFQFCILCEVTGRAASASCLERFNICLVYLGKNVRMAQKWHAVVGIRPI
jgi:hypothetical protein